MLLNQKRFERRALCRTAHGAGQRRDIMGDTANRGPPMTTFLAILAALVGLVIWRVLSGSRPSADPAPHGRMSERWLAEHRASSQA